MASTTRTPPTHKRYFSEDTTNKQPNADTPPTNGQTAQSEDRFAALQDSYLRALADMENLRTRTKKEVDSASQFAIQKFAKDVIGVADVLEMAVHQSSATAATAEAMREGMEMTLEELRKVLKQHGIAPIDPLHQRFDPNQHMALYEVPSGEVEAGTVMTVQKKGYLLNGRVIRAAQVAVSRKP